MQPRLAVEEYFARSGRTFRKSAARLCYEEKIKPRLMKTAFRALGLYARGVRNALTPRVRSLQLHFPDLPPAFDGFTILHISDLHIDGVDGLAESLAPLLRRLRPDLCALTGDYRYEIRGACAEVYPRLQHVISSISARLGIIGILGNHDAAEIAIQLEQMGVRMLVNDAAEVSVGGSSVWFIGVDDSFDYRCDDLPKAMSKTPSGAFKVLLAHSPQLYREAAAAGIQLYLCGHTHAGQIRLPFIGAVKKNTPVPKGLIQGHWSHEGMQGYTTWGAGCSTLPVRYRCPPEVALIELKNGRTLASFLHNN